MSFMGFTGTLSPRIRILSKLTILSLQGNQITGGIPEDYGNLTSLTMLDLENNSLTGPIPSSLGNLKNSTIFDIEPKQSRRAYPRLTIKSTELDEHVSKFNFTGNKLNCDLNNTRPCTSGSGDASKKSKAGILIGVIAGVLVLLLLGCLMLFLWRGRHKGYKREVFVDVPGDFGLAKLVDVRKTNVTTQVRGTMGHIAPEYLSTGKSSERTDIFGYGIMLLEIVTGQRAIDFSRLEEEDDVLLLDHVKKLEREKRLDAIVDRNLNKRYNMEEVEMMIKVALLCTQGSPEDQPAMSEVVRMLEGEGLAERWEEWQNVEVTRRQEYDRLQRRFDWGEDSIYNQDAIELSGGR